MTSNDIDNLLTIANELVDHAGVLARRYFRQPFESATKADMSIVTEADTTIEAQLRNSLHECLPDHAFLGEETGESGPASSDYLWVIDPIDGTRSFASGVPTFTTLVGLLHAGRPVLGIIDQPILGDRWVGAAGRATTLNGREVRARAGCRSLNQAVLASTNPRLFRPDDAEAFEALSDEVHAVMYGLDGYGYGILSAGWLDLVVEGTLKAHDIMALLPVIEGAGGVVTDWYGEPVTLQFDGRVIAAGNAEIHATALGLLQSKGRD